MIDRYCENDLDEGESKEFQINLKNSPLLRKELETNERLDKFLTDQETIDLMEKIRNVRAKTKMKHRKYMLIIVAAAVVFLALYWLSLMLLRGKRAG